MKDAVISFQEKKQKAVDAAEAGLAKAEERARVALDEYERQVDIHRERGDGFFSGEYHKARKEAVLAQKFLRGKQAALRTAIHERDATPLPEMP